MHALFKCIDGVAPKLPTLHFFLKFSLFPFYFCRLSCVVLGKSLVAVVMVLNASLRTVEKSFAM